MILQSENTVIIDMRMSSLLPRSNKESWVYVAESLNEYPNTEYWNQWRAILAPLIDKAIRAGYDEFFRAGTSLHHIIISTLDHHGVSGKPHVTFFASKDWEIEIHYSTANMNLGSAIHSQKVSPSDAFEVLTKFLQHLWTETVAEPIPEGLRKIKK